MNAPSSNTLADPLWSKGLLFIKLRWGALVAATGLLGLSLAFGSRLGISAAPIAVVAGIIGISNLIFHLIHVRLHRGERDAGRARLYTVVFMLEVVADYGAATILIQHYGFSVLNLAFLYLPHVILTGMVCERKRMSLVVTVMSLLLIYGQAFVHREAIHRGVTAMLGQEIPVSGALLVSVFNTGIFLFVFLLTNIIVQDMKRRRNELLEINRQLVEMDREKQNYTLRATHELKAPFAAIQSYTEVILGGYMGEIDPKLRKVMIKIRNRSDSLAKMIKHIIQLSNLRTTMFKTDDYSRVSLRDLAGNTVEKFDDRAKAEKILLEVVQSGPEAIETFLISGLFEILLDNLVSNAIQYSQAESVVTVNIRRANDDLEVSVRDRGIGIPEESVSKVFEEHYRCENAQEVNPQGNGMGLAIVQEVVRLHHGTIRVESTEGEGTEFFVSIPDLQAPPEPDRVL